MFKRVLLGRDKSPSVLLIVGVLLVVVGGSFIAGGQSIWAGFIVAVVGGINLGEAIGAWRLKNAMAEIGKNQ